VIDAAVVEKRTDHVRRDLARALRVKLVSGRRLELSIDAGQRSPETSTEKAVGLVMSNTKRRGTPVLLVVLLGPRSVPASRAMLIGTPLDVCISSTRSSAMPTLIDVQ
jgi:hypothetical protein